MKKYLENKNLWDKKEETKLLDQYNLEIGRQFEEAENYPSGSINDVFQFQYEKLPDELNRQKIAYEKYLNWKESRK